MPGSSSGLGHGTTDAKTRVRILLWVFKME